MNSAASSSCCPFSSSPVAGRSAGLSQAPRPHDFHRDSFECAQETLHSTETSIAPSFWLWGRGSTSSETKVSEEL